MNYCYLIDVNDVEECLCFSEFQPNYKACYTFGSGSGVSAVAFSQGIISDFGSFLSSNSGLLVALAIGLSVSFIFRGINR